MSPRGRACSKTPALAGSAVAADDGGHPGEHHAGIGHLHVWGAGAGRARRIAGAGGAHRPSRRCACEPGGELLLARDGTVSACRLAAAAECWSARRRQSQGACAAGAQVEFHRSGYLSFCNPSRRCRRLSRPKRPQRPNAAPDRGSPSTRAGVWNTAPDARGCQPWTSLKGCRRLTHFPEIAHEPACLAAQRGARGLLVELEAAATSSSSASR